MTHHRLARYASVALASLTTVGVFAADTVSGTFTAGAPVRLTHVYASLEADKRVATRTYLMILVSDVAVAPSAQSDPPNHNALASAGTLHAVRIRWVQGTDAISVVPYHSRIADSGLARPSAATVNVTKLSDTLIDAQFKSKMLGQTWTFDATVKAAISRGGSATLEPDEALVSDASGGPGKPSLGGKTGTPDATASKMKLGSMGFEYTQAGFFQAIGRHNVDAVNLYLAAGMSPNQKDARGRYALNQAVLTCGQQAYEGSAVIISLLAAKADVKTTDPDNKTTALVGAVQSCNIDAINALIKAGSDLNAKSAAGTTALQLATIFQRADIADALRKAGAK
jgi:hypothetical protein